MIGIVLKFAIRAYKKWVSPTLPASCRYHPTCSDYAIQSIEKHGAIKGGLLSLRRLLCCNRLSKGGYDPV